MAKLYESGENYLETILMLHMKGQSVRSIDVAREMEVSKPSVSRAVGILRDGGFLLVESDGDLTLTETGREVAERIYERHRVLTDWLIGLGVSAETAAEDACKLEHHISEESFRCLKEHILSFHKGLGKG